MIDTKAEIAQRLSVLVGLDVSWVSHAADMLTVQFGPQRQYTTRRGTVLEGGAWALHVQCKWRLDRGVINIATREDLCGLDEKAHSTADRLRMLLVERGPCKVENVSVDDAAGVMVSLSQGYSLAVVPDGVTDEEDWRFFAPGVNAAHLVIEGGTIAAESFD